jgi:hypothetical protein
LVAVIVFILSRPKIREAIIQEAYDCLWTFLLGPQTTTTNPKVVTSTSHQRQIPSKKQKSAIQEDEETTPKAPAIAVFPSEPVPSISEQHSDHSVASDSSLASDATRASASTAATEPASCSALSSSQASHCNDTTPCVHYCYVADEDLEWCRKGDSILQVLARDDKGTDCQAMSFSINKTRGTFFCQSFHKAGDVLPFEENTYSIFDEDRDSHLEITEIFLLLDTLDVPLPTFPCWPSYSWTREELAGSFEPHH